MNIALIGYEANIKNRVGSNQYAFELIKALYRLDLKNSYCVYLSKPPVPDLPIGRKNWQYKIVGPARLWNVLGLPLALFRQEPKPDVVFNPGHYSPLFFPAPLVVSVMDLGYLRYPGQFTLPIRAKLKFWTYFSIKRASHIFAISEFTRNDIIKTYRILPDKVTATPLSYSRSQYRAGIREPVVNKIAKKYHIEGKYLLFLGTLKPNKNIEGLLEAFEQLGKSKATKVKLVIAGKKGWLYESIYQKVKDLNLQDRVIFPGFVDEKDVVGLMAGAELFVMPSFWEGFGIPVLEAMAVGTPVVVANIASLPEIVGQAGMLVDPYSPESIARGIEEAIVKRQELRQKGIERASQFSWRKCARQTLTILEKVSQNPRCQ
ncbi:MAG TPA: glycosyltransferase family 1 protein [Candidatus Bathyarchaeia archaeon]|nr:glycosyltransferase family 1 protein [Candidatus Bathyarchaeia archaeon]